jgi:hypothetical protein
MTDKIIKYFELPLQEIKTWGWKEYLLFVIESLYTTVFPFIAGTLMVQRNQPIWVLMLILPIYFRLSVLKKYDKTRSKRIYVK